MEEYEKFCEKALTRVQEASLSAESFLPAQAQSVSLIRFHGVAVLSPLLTIEKRKEIQQEKQKALDVQTRKQANRKKALLTRVQEILENVQVRKAPNASDFDQWATETVSCSPEFRDLNAPATVPNSLPSPTEDCTPVKLEKITGLLPLGNKDRHSPNELSLSRDSKGSGSPKRGASPDSRQTVNGAALRLSTGSSQETHISDSPLLAKEKQDPSCLADITPDPYIMSLQNLMKKSKEYMEREQARRSLRSSAKRSVSESHSDKENDAAKASDCVKEKAPPMPTGRHCGSTIPDKPSLNKSNVLLQGASQASNMGTSVLASFSKVDLPVGTDSPAVPDVESAFKVFPTFITENKGIKTLTGPYAKLPSPEPSVSPPMHRRRSRPSSACQILINNPVNACELSPKGKEEAVDRVAPAAAEETTNESEIVPKSPTDLTGVCSSKVSASKILLGTTRDTVVAGVAEQERDHLPERRYPKGSVCMNRNKMLETSPKGQEVLKMKMLAFEEMRKRLEEQHAQQLSLLIAEQEREQERLQREIEEQEKMLTEKAVTADVSDLNSMLELEWRKRSGSALLETVLSQVDLLQASDNSGFTNSALQQSFGSASEGPFYLWGSLTSGVTKLSITRPFGRAQAKWSQVFSPEIQAKFNKITAVAKGFLTRKLMQTDKLKQLRQTVKDTMEFIRSFQSEAPLKRGVVSAQDASLQERVLAQLRAALYGIHDIFFVMDAAERMSILHHDREARKEKLLRQMDKMKSPRVALSAATQKSLDRKKFMKVAEMGMPNKKFLLKQNPSETRVLQPSQGQNAPVHRLLSRQGTPKTSVKGVVQNRQKPSQSRVPNRAPVSDCGNSGGWKIIAESICRKNPKKAAKCCDNLRRQHSLG
ncbi:centriolar coiled-coil protein of 110 kDa isoform X10 [Mesocricetus auratus]|uniref:Centriolar coiled-coil protein of 110 kDa isoform X10 n=1 Tax=Mesocricetus auratus TaxID=10036 RepID=A0ABM2YA29_MESAU|nr:centriolar coiled-coil protein of 110 kDa isoform X10 [Mesocricetus auratus]